MAGAVSHGAAAEDVPGDGAETAADAVFRSPFRRLTRSTREHTIGYAATAACVWVRASSCCWYLTHEIPNASWMAASLRRSLRECCDSNSRMARSVSVITLSPHVSSIRSVSVVPLTLAGMGVRRRDRWLPPEAFSLSEEARGVVRAEFDPPRPVRCWLQAVDRLIRVDAVALAATDDAVLVEWGNGQAKTSVWIWRAAVKHRRDDETPRPSM